jgi:N-acetylglucosamine kinase-like BadF-type ATPase
MKVMCKCCRGSGKQMGGGFVQTICENCDGCGKVILKKADDKNKDSTDRRDSVPASDSAKIDKRSAAYKKAIKELVEQGLSEKEAKKVFDAELEKLDGKTS